MAFQVEKIHPLDLQPRKAVGVTIPFSANDVFTSTYTTQDALKANLINYLLTNQGERFFNPDFGAGLRALLFEQMTQDLQEEIKARITSGIYTWFPTVTVTEISISESPDTNTITIYMKYKVMQTNIQDELLINFAQ